MILIFILVMLMILFIRKDNWDLKRTKLWSKYTKNKEE